MDKMKEGLKKAGYAAVGAGATIYEKGKQIYEKVAPKVNDAKEKSNKFTSKLSNKYDELAEKGINVLNKKQNKNND